MNLVFEKYISEYSADLTRLCISLCGNITDAEDLFQDTWYKAMKNYTRYNPEKSFEKWIYSICVNTYKDSLRLFYNKRRVFFKTEEDKTDFLNSIPDSSPDNSEDYLELHTAINTLPKKQKVVIVLYYFKDYSLNEISEMLNVPLGTVKSRLNLAKSNLRRRLNNEKV
ncbi:MAG: sigma-70 family RNA polymerase sigma factor [Ruminococcus sp.]|nr:sigma-70 family RNA polymerase sigma factor [Ruminococcus sp.]